MKNYLYLKRGSSFKKITFNSIEELKLKLDLDDIYEEEILIKHLKKFKELYCYIDPYKSEINEKCVLNYALSKEEADSEYSDLMENI